MADHFVTVGDDFKLPAQTAATLPTQDEVGQKAGKTYVDAQVLGASTAGVTALSKLGAGFDFNKSLTFAVASDSTSNDTNDWPSVWMHKLGARYPGMQVVRRAWNDTTQAYDTDGVLQPGTPAPILGGVVMNDTFTRSGDLHGSVSDNGVTWSSVPDTGSVFSTDGTSIVSLVPTYGVSQFDTLQRGGTMTVEIDLISSGNGVNQQLRYFLGASPAFASEYVMLYVSINSTGGVSIGLYERIGGVNITTQTFPAGAGGIVRDSATSQHIKLELNIAIQNVVATLTGPDATPVSINYTMSESDYAALGTYSGISNAGNVASVGIKTASFNVTAPSSPGYVQTLLGVISSIGGGILEYQRSRIAALYPVETPVDVMMISHSHNYGNSGPEVLTDAIDAFISQYKILHPESKYLICSQNPEQAPFANRAFHAIRNAALRQYAMTKGYSYLPAFEEFAKQPDGGASLVGAEGVHPTTTTVGTTVGAFGAVLWSDVIDREVQNNQFVK